MPRSRARKSEPVAESPTTTTEPTAAFASPAEEAAFNAAFNPPPDIQAEQIVHGVAEPVKVSEERAASHSVIANPSSKRRESHVESVQRKLPSKLTVVAGDLKVQLIDAGRNEMGIGIRVALPEGRTLTDDEKQLIREHVKGTAEEPSGFAWDPNVQMWHKHILRDGEHLDDVPPSRPVAIRFDAERRIEQLAEALREHQADPVGYAAMLQQRREQTAQAGRVPD